MTDSRNYYDLLGIDKNASASDIKKAYRRLAMKHHPDRNKGNKESEQEFKKISEAYETLSDSSKKATYDQVGHSAYSSGGMGQGAGGFSGAGDFGDVFSQIFGGGDFGDIFGGGGGRSRSRARKGQDLAYNLELTLEEAVFGVEKKITFPQLETCDKCDGTGAKNGTSFSNCQTCHGTGQIHIQQGFLSMSQTCPSCQGAGKVITEKCIHCHGHGQIKKNTTLSVKIPAGVDNNDRIRLSGKGESGAMGGPSGDLYIQIQVKQHSIFSREGENLSCEIPISFVTAALGGEIEVPTMEKAVKLKIPAETQSGNTFRLRGKGVKHPRQNRHGDLFCKVMVETPINLNSKQKKTLRDFDNLLNESKQNHFPKSSRWIDGIKKFFTNAS